LLQHIGERKAAESIRRAVDAVLTEGADVTPDLGGTGSTTKMAEAIARFAAKGVA
jgi:tartrate dehydrogenase/decarboxylase/D-malate dehydrogenase